MIVGQLKRIYQLQNNINGIDSVSNPNIISLSSGKGGTGKSVIAVILAISLANANKKVLLVDLDLGFPNLNILLNRHSVKSLDDFCFRNFEITEVITKIDSNLDVIWGLSENPLKLNSTKHLLNSIVNEIKKQSNNYDFLILDTGAGVDEFLMRVLKISNFKILVSNSDPTSIMDAYALIKIFENSEKASNFFLIINNCENQQVGMESFLKLKKAVNSFLKSSIELFATIPQQNEIKNAVNNQNLSEIFKTLLTFPSIKSILSKFSQMDNINHTVKINHI